VDANVIGLAHRELGVLATSPVLAMANENRRALVRYGDVDRSWVRDKSAIVDDLEQRLAAVGEPDPEAWFDRILELVRAIEGDPAAIAVDDARTQRTTVRDRVEALVGALETGVPPEDTELARLVGRLESARKLPGRARRRRVLDVLRAATGWSAAPADAVWWRASTTSRPAPHHPINGVTSSAPSSSARHPSRRSRSTTKRPTN